MVRPEVHEPDVSAHQVHRIHRVPSLRDTRRLVVFHFVEQNDTRNRSKLALTSVLVPRSLMSGNPAITRKVLVNPGGRGYQVTDTFDGLCGKAS